MVYLWLWLLFFLAVKGSHLPRYARLIAAENAANSSYDFIIIGGGTSGLTVADRLTEDPSSKICVPFHGIKSPALIFLWCAQHP